MYQTPKKIWKAQAVGVYSSIGNAEEAIKR
jgi:hypothetical protein